MADILQVLLLSLVTFMNRLGQNVSLGASVLCVGFCPAVNHLWVAGLADAMSRIDTPSSYAKSIERQAELATGKVFNCYRSSQRPIPLALLYPFFDTFFWNASDTADLQQRDTLFTLELCQKMQGFVGKESRRELDFGTLFRDYLQGILPATKIKHQIKGKSIIDIQLQVQVCASCCSV